MFTYLKAGASRGVNREAVSQLKKNKSKIKV